MSLSDRPFVAELTQTKITTPEEIRSVSNRLLFIASTLTRCGAGNQLARVASGLSADQFDVHVAALRGGPLADELRSSGIEVTELDWRWPFDPPAFARLVGLVRSLAPKLIHTWPNAAQTPGRLAARLGGVSCIVATERGVDLWKTAARRRTDRRLARRTRRMIATSDVVRDFYVSLGIAAEKLVVIPDGIKLGVAGQLTRSQLLDELGLDNEARLIATVGRLWSHRGIKDMIWSIDLLKTARDHVHLLVLGDGPYRGRAERYRTAVRVEERVHFLGHREDVHDVLPLVDLCWQAGRCEGAATALMEAMAAGRPVVASDIPAHRMLVRDNETGFLTGAGDRAAMASRAYRLLDDPALAERLGRSAQARVAEHFAAAVMIARHEALYRELLDD